MRTKRPNPFWRLGLLGVLAIASTLLPARPAPACYDDPVCYHNCWLMCEPYYWESYHMYQSCMNQCTPSCTIC